MSFKDDDQLITKYNYPSEDSYDDLDSLDHFNSALDSDSGSSESSTFDEEDDAVGEDYELEVVKSTSTLRSFGSRQKSDAKIILSPSNASTVSTSTLKGSISRQPRLPVSSSTTFLPFRGNSLDRPQNRRSSSYNINNVNGYTNPYKSSNGFKDPQNSKWLSAYTSSPILLTPSKTGSNSSKSRKITCKTEKL